MYKFDYYKLNDNLEKHDQHSRYIHIHTNMMHYLNHTKKYNDFLYRYR